MRISRASKKSLSCGQSVLKDVSEISKKFEDFNDMAECKQCINCSARFPSLLLQKNWCSRCRKNPTKFAQLNDMDPGHAVLELTCLGLIEEKLIELYWPFVSVYKTSGNQYGYSGHVISFPQDIHEITTNLPKTLVDLKGDTVERFEVNADRLRTALIYLKKNNKYYEDISINEERLTQSSLVDDV